MRSWKKPRVLVESRRSAIADEVKMMLHAHRDCLRNLGVDTKTIRFDCRDGYYGEAFGVMRALSVLGYGRFGAVNLPEEYSNLRWWFAADKCDAALERAKKAEAELDLLRREVFTSLPSPEGASWAVGADRNDPISILLSYLEYVDRALDAAGGGKIS